MLEWIFGPLAARVRWVATALAVQERYGKVRGNYLASAVTLNLFMSIVPALLVSVAVVGFFTNRSAELPGAVVDNLGLTGSIADRVRENLEEAARSRKTASLVGLLLLAWTGLGTVAALQYAFDATWQHSGRDIRDRIKGIYWGTGAVLILSASVGLTAGVDVAADGWLITVLFAILAGLINFGLWIWTFVRLSYPKIAWHAFVPGAVIGAVGLEILKQAASPIGKAVASSSSIYGPFVAVFAILLILLVFGRMIVYASVLNVVIWERKHGTVIANIEVPNVPGQSTGLADRAGAVETEEGSKSGGAAS